MGKYTQTVKILTFTKNYTNYAVYELNNVLRRRTDAVSYAVAATRALRVHGGGMYCQETQMQIIEFAVTKLIKAECRVLYWKES